MATPALASSEQGETISSELARPTLLDLPIETLEEICSSLPLQDKRSIRLVKWDFADVGARTLFRHIKLYVNGESFRKFEAVCNHPVFARYVQSVVFDTRAIQITMSRPPAMSIMQSSDQAPSTISASPLDKAEPICTKYAKLLHFVTEQSEIVRTGRDYDLFMACLPKLIALKDVTLGPPGNSRETIPNDGPFEYWRQRGETWVASQGLRSSREPPCPCVRLTFPVYGFMHPERNPERCIVSFLKALRWCSFRLKSLAIINVDNFMIHVLTRRKYGLGAPCLQEVTNFTLKLWQRGPAERRWRKAVSTVPMLTGLMAWQKLWRVLEKMPSLKHIMLDQLNDVTSSMKGSWHEKHIPVPFGMVFQPDVHIAHLETLRLGNFQLGGLELTHFVKRHQSTMTEVFLERLHSRTISGDIRRFSSSDMENLNRRREEEKEKGRINECGCKVWIKV
ncbi:hypothetical protein M406DRAFT_72613 [Cryphonectria parasitica EP155]|uniref:F-box domain-containing protein n=1 Tax=Cryphonectria parasitica (strain ATCC 38755 / EP155) TaxID=660469 RepID=A0A9P4XXA5_CRYP1|nr:uncharacterized protein M406DRAFT_72613 [Cryphonectria parasitica EP155]KAF3762629.1 hypothetical protein M406DRAFT_72613 [Cryphonectria parasitica EP155]